MSDIHKRIKELRKEAGMTQEELGNKIGMAKSTISLYESGNSSPEDKTKMKLADLFGVTIDYLMGRTDNKRLIKVDTKEKTDYVMDYINKVLLETGQITEEEYQNGIKDKEKEKVIVERVIKAIRFAKEMK